MKQNKFWTRLRHKKKLIQVLLLNRHILLLDQKGAEIAKRADVKELWLTHFSPALAEPEAWAENAVSVFENTKVGFDGMTKTIYFEG